MEKYCRAGQAIFFIVSLSVLLRMRNVSDEVIEKFKTCFVLNDIF